MIGAGLACGDDAVVKADHCELAAGLVDQLAAVNKDQDAIAFLCGRARDGGGDDCFGCWLNGKL